MALKCFPKKMKSLKLARMNIQRYNNPAKRECIDRMSEERGLELEVLIVTKTKLKERRSLNRLKQQIFLENIIFY